MPRHPTFKASGSGFGSTNGSFHRGTKADAQRQTNGAWKSDTSIPTEPHVPTPTLVESQPIRCGKAPPVDPFTEETMETILDDWLPTLQRAATWNAWSEEEKLLQLAGHLRGRALQEWSLLGDGDKSSFEGAIEALQEKLDPGSMAMAAQDFRHISQGD